MLNNSIDYSETYVAIGECTNHEFIDQFMMLICPLCKHPSFCCSDFEYDDSYGYMWRDCLGRLTATCINCNDYILCCHAYNTQPKFIDGNTCRKEIHDVDCHISSEMLKLCDKVLDEYKEYLELDPMPEFDVKWYNVAVNKLTHYKYLESKNGSTEYTEIEPPIVFFEASKLDKPELKAYRSKCLLCDLETDDLYLD